jgi:hypothetical protein
MTSNVPSAAGGDVMTVAGACVVVLEAGGRVVSAGGWVVSTGGNVLPTGTVACDALTGLVVVVVVSLETPMGASPSAYAGMAIPATGMARDRATTLIIDRLTMDPTLVRKIADTHGRIAAYQSL